MSHNPLFYSLDSSIKTADLRDQIQIALAIADETLLRALLTHSIAPIIPPQCLARVSSEVGVPTGDRQVADGVLHFETVECVLSASLEEGRDRSRVTQYESELHTLGSNLPLAPMVALLTESGFTPKQIQDILRLPQDGWHKSWWYSLDSHSHFTVPFLRHIRLVRYVDGTLTLQYKDFFEQNKPSCFTRTSKKVLVAIKPDEQGFGETLKQLNYQRSALEIQQAVLVCNRISELEAQAFIRQGISLYPAVELLLPTQANCGVCGRSECPMNGIENSTVVLCHGFLLTSEYV